MAPTRLRGALGALNQLVICTGILLVLCVNVALDTSAWRSFFTLGAAPAVALLLGGCGRSFFWEADRQGVPVAWSGVPCPRWRCF